MKMAELLPHSPYNVPYGLAVNAGSCSTVGRASDS